MPNKQLCEYDSPVLTVVDVEYRSGAVPRSTHHRLCSRAKTIFSSAHDHPYCKICFLSVYARAVVQTWKLSLLVEMICISGRALCVPPAAYPVNKANARRSAKLASEWNEVFLNTNILLPQRFNLLLNHFGGIKILAWWWMAISCFKYNPAYLMQRMRWMK